MHLLTTLLLDALAAGQVTVRFGRIHDRAGWLNPLTRVITINPDATPERLEAELLHDLAGLAEQRAPAPPPLRLLEGGGGLDDDGDGDPTPMAAE